jgi:transposase
MWYNRERLPKEVLMHLNVSRRKNGRVYLSIVHGYRNSEGKNRTKTIKSLGYVDELEKKFADPITHFRGVAAEMESERKAAVAHQMVRIDPNATLDGQTLRKNLGFVALSKIYHELGLAPFYTRVGNKTKSQFNLNQVMKLLVYERILNPGSKRRAAQNKDAYFEKFDFSEHDLYRALDEIAKSSHQVQAHLHKQVCAQYGRETSLLYYDVTNYYFESDVTDELRKKGVSKENRSDPLVAMGLLIDTKGLPLSFDIFPGNTNDCKTLLPILSKVKNNYGAGRVIVVADKGVNTSDNCAYNLIKGDGYVFSKSVRGAEKSLRDWCLDRSGYRWETEDQDRAIKSRIAVRNLYIEGSDGRKKAIAVEERQVAVYSRKYALRAKRKREEALLKAQALISDKGSYARAVSYGAAKYVKGLDVDKKTGEILSSAKVLTLDVERIKREERFDGFYLLVSSEKKKSGKEIAGMYSGLAKIEESFKVTKSNLKTRPIYVWTEKHIRAHFQICFTALLIIRILEMKLEHKHSIEALIKAMKAASGTCIESNWWAFDYRSETLDDIGVACDIDFTKRYLRPINIRKVIADTKK